MGDKYNYHGHDDGLVVTQPRSGQFEERPMTPAELAAREPARAIADDIYRHANYAGVCYHEIWETIAKAMHEPLSQRDATIAELRTLADLRDKAVTEACARLKSMEGTIAELTAQRDGYRGAVERKHEHLLRVEAERDKAEREAATLTSALEEANADREQLQAALNREQELHRDACQRAVEANRDRESYQHGMVQAQRDAATYMQEREDLRAKLEEANRERERLERHAEDVEKSNMRLTSEAARLREDAGRWRALLPLIGKSVEVRVYDAPSRHWMDAGAGDLQETADAALSSNADAKERGDG